MESGGRRPEKKTIRDQGICQSCINFSFSPTHLQIIIIYITIIEDENPVQAQDFGKLDNDVTIINDPLAQDRERRVNSYGPLENKSDQASIASDSTISSGGRRYRHHHEERHRQSIDQLNKRLSVSITAKDRFREPTKLVRKIEFTAFKYIAAVCSVNFLLGKFGFSMIFAIAVVIMGGVGYWYFGTQPSKKDLEWQLDNQQEEVESLYTSEGETVEWMNFMIEKIWRSIDQDFFTALQSMIEDNIQSIAPSFIKGISIYDLDIGPQAPRVQSIRVFPPLPGHSEESIFGEASFSFHQHPAASLSAERGRIKPSPPGVTVAVQTGVTSPISVRGELTALYGKLRFKLITGPDLPFISKLTVAFTNVPTVETAVMPLTNQINLMHIPWLKMLVNEGLKIGLTDLVDPKSMTLDFQQLMGGTAQDTAALGVIRVEIRGAKADPSVVRLQEIEDSYATLSLSNQPKRSMSSTRVLTNDKDPRWNEVLYVLISRDDISADTNVDIRVWDADKIKFDDVWGTFSIPAREIIQSKMDKLGNVIEWCQEERVAFDGWAPLDGKSFEECQMKVNCKISFHPKYITPKKDVIKETDIAAKEEAENEQKAVSVDPEHKSGILSVFIRQGMDLEIGDAEELAEEELKHPYNSDQVVSPYACLYLNDSKVYQTRSKLRNPSPHWNAVSEHFIKGFNETTIRISVKAALDLERDPVLGIKMYHLRDLFNDKGNSEYKEAQTWFPLSDGVGFGKVLVTLKYKPVHLTIPRELSGADVGTLIVDSVQLEHLSGVLDSSRKSVTRATLSLNVDPVIEKRLKPHDLQPNEIAWIDHHLFFPLIMRYRSALYIHIGQGSMGGHKATGRVWLKEIPDNEWQYVQIGLFNSISEQSKEANRNEDPWDSQGAFGYAVLRVKVVPGFSPVHTHLRSFNMDMVGVDPFHTEKMKAKEQHWIREQGGTTVGSNSDHADEGRGAHDFGSFDSDTGSTIISNDNEDEDEENSADEYTREIFGLNKSSKVSKHRVLRKATWGKDIVKQHIDNLRQGFNSEARNNRTVAKDV
ncbi:hypothetical protein BDA99DRAFT_475827 [Phascolomyces articulosus]|uniref:C2 domain-containing protein n=1 Tax=Phascolomyces articulosus TaxID=60185 RepID=A0AAD5K9Q6_9FUNG|nr:hypothetical protein BDA99DRAFT_475827 [Phascolomyces articulosus]